MIVDAQTQIGSKVPEALIDIFDLTLGQSASFASCLAELKGEKDKTADHVLELECEQVKLNSKVFSLKDQFNKLLVDKEFLSAEVVAVCAQCDKRNAALTLQRTELKRLRVILAAKPDPVELLKGCTVAKRGLISLGT